MPQTLILKTTRKVVRVGNSCALIIPYIYKKGLYEQNKSEGTWIVTKDEKGTIHVEVKFAFLEKGSQKPEETEGTEEKKIIRTKFKPKHKEEWVLEGQCQKCGQIAQLYKKGQKLVCKNCM